MAPAAMISIRFPITVETVDGRDRDSKIVVARRVVFLGDEADLVLRVVISVVSWVTAGRSVLSVLSRDHLYHPRALIARAGLHHFRVHQDRLSPASLVSPPLIQPSNRISNNIVLKCLVTNVIRHDIMHHLGVRAPTRLQVQGLVLTDRDRVGVKIRVRLLPRLMQFRR